MITQLKAEEIASRYAGDEPTLDPMTIMMIVRVIIEGISMLYKCYNTPQALSNELRSPNFATKLYLARLINKHFRGTGVNQRKLRNHMLQTDFTESELMSLIEESNK
jgi:hypothetical protein